MEVIQMLLASSLVNLDTKRIPFTISEQDSVKDIIVLKYELGNLFFLQLELPGGGADIISKNY